ncbi:MAG TPA: ABC transporter ATP-binding protein [Mycobacteriales bacterium]|nr:ABC transporter ATP-binding protein [Mycobacteriales bacterium]
MILDVQNLGVTARDGSPLVSDVSFRLEPGERLSLIGESGSGKSLTSFAITGLLPDGLTATGSVELANVQVVGAKERALVPLRGRTASTVFQEPLTALDPLMRLGAQVAEPLRRHLGLRGAALRDAVHAALEEVRLPDPERIARAYPHEISGGQRQRVAIAAALACRPQLLIADEPTTALDVTVQAQILDLIQRLQREFETAVIMITHDLGVVAELADQVLVMYAGKPVEVADSRTIYYGPHHPYTKGLIESIPSASSIGHQLRPITGQPPSLINLPRGCSFHPRCPYVMPQCRSDIPPLEPIGAAEHLSACFLPETALGFSEESERLRGAAAGVPLAGASAGAADAETTNSPSATGRASA